ncbi:MULTISPECIES: 5-bromo-4-chloroindolyl phosphate hydrolysis family protein [Enterococcus]|uniref:5-bromo-4-chloroindolyl phosphate hydrolysis family protein n=1 Tax=Enterococcus sp. AZ103 TaxID=2774628 RepID=UPI003F21ACEA
MVTVVIILNMLVLGIVFFIWIVVRTLSNYSINKVFIDRQKKFKTEHQMSDQDLRLFQQTMEELKKQIIYIEQVTNMNNHLKKIEKKEAGIVSAKQIFQELMNEPKDLTKYGDFIYKKLPSMEHACSKLMNIEDSNLNTPEIKDSKNNILQTINFISSSITDDYERLVEEDSTEIALSKKVIGEKK